MKQMFAFYNSQAYQEISKGLQEKNKQYVSNFYEFAKNQSDNLTDVSKINFNFMNRRIYCGPT
jgi:hypothetical protein